MPIGDYYYLIANGKISRYIIRLLGVLDLHSHIRLKPMIKFLNKYFQQNVYNKSLSILEVGCGSGINLFEILKLSKRFNITIEYVGIDLSFDSISTANNILSKLPNEVDKSKLHFIHGESSVVLNKYKDSNFDIILLIDVIEHILKPEQLLSSLDKLLKNNGLLVISVPTPLYPKFFGRKFHDKIGHVVDGYLLEDLDKMITSLSFERIYERYNTGLFSNIGCWLYYNKLNFSNKYLKNKYLNFLKQVLLYPFKFMDFYNNCYVSCSLFVVYKKRSNSGG